MTTIITTTPKDRLDAPRTFGALLVWLPLALAAACTHNGLVDATLSIAVTVDEVKPAEVSTRGGEEVTLVGANFGPSAKVRVAGEQVTAERLSDSVLRFFAPAHGRAKVDIEVRLDDGRRGGCEGCLAYASPRPMIGKLLPARGPTAGGTEVTIEGQGFEPGDEVRFGDERAEVLDVSADRLVVRAPPSGHGPVTVSVRSPDPEQPTSKRERGFRYYRAKVVFADRHKIADGVFNDVLAGDLDGDGDEDVVLLPHDTDAKYTPTRSLPEAHVLLNDGQGGLSAAKVHDYGSAVGKYEDVVYTALCDWNNDGRADLLVLLDPAPYGAPAAASRVLYLPARASGALGAAAPVKVAASPRLFGIACGDLDGDGATDLALLSYADAETQRVRLAFGDGGGGVRNERELAVPENAEFNSPGPWLDIGDQDGDGVDDLAVFGHPRGQGSAWLRLWSGFNRATQNFRAIDLPVDTPRAKDAGVFGGDLDGDGRREWVHPAVFGNLVVLREPTAGGKPTVTIEQPEVPDKRTTYGVRQHRTPSVPARLLVTAGSFGQQGDTLAGFSLHVWSAGQVIAAGDLLEGRSVHAAHIRALAQLDADAQGPPDVVYADADGAYLVSGGKAPPASFGLVGGKRLAARQAELHYPALADLDGDGLTDLVGLRWQRTPSSGPGRGPWRAWVVSQLNVSQRLDGVSAMAKAAELEFAQNNSDPDSLLVRFRPAVSSPVVGDLDGDGRADLLLSTGQGLLEGERLLQAFFNQGNGRFSPPRVTRVREPTITHPSQICDVDGDGRADVIHQQNRHLSRGDGKGSFAAPVALPLSEAAGWLGTTPRETHLANVDGRPGCELVIVGVDRAVVARYRDGALEAVGEPFDLPPLTEGIEKLADLDSDGDLDLLLTHRPAQASELRCLFNDGGGGFGEASSRLGTLPGNRNSRRLHLADVNGDGLADVLVLGIWAPSTAPSRLLLLLNEGAEGFSHVEQLLNTHILALPADIDGDGLADLVDVGYASTFGLIDNVSR